MITLFAALALLCGGVFMLCLTLLMDFVIVCVIVAFLAYCLVWLVFWPFKTTYAFFIS